MNELRNPLVSNHLRTFLAALCCLIASACDVGASELLPPPVDVPSGPAGVAGPGGAALPSFAGEPTKDGPAISAVSETTLPDETLVLSGDRLAGARLRVWMEGRVDDLSPLRTADNRMQAVLPKEWPSSTMLVWPVRGEAAGSPIRVNGATLWWAWPPRLVCEGTGEAATIRLMGKNLKLGDTEPKVYLAGSAEGQWLPVESAHAYQVVARVPRLSPGRYEVFVHNGTGERFGWSEAARVEVVAPRNKGPLPVFDAARFGAKPDDSRDDAAAIQQAIDAAVKAGGGKVTLSGGTFHLGRTVVLPEATGAGVELAGSGIGDYDPRSRTVPGGTVLRFLPDSAPPKCLVEVGTRFGSLAELTLIGGHEGVVRAIHDRNAPSQVVVRVAQHDVALRRVRMVLLDLRPEVPPEDRKDLQIYDAALHIVAPGSSNVVVRDCEFHSAGSGIEIGTMQQGHTDAEPPEPSTDDVCIERCVFRGYSRGFYREPSHRGSYAHMGIFNEGIQVPNGKRVIIQRCDFAGADRRGGKMIGRSICVCNTSTRPMYIAENRSHDVGMVCPRQDRVVNQGEQILFHFRYPHGGYFDLVEAGAAEVAVDPSDPRNAGKISSPHMAFDRAASRVLEEVGENRHWVVFVSAGKGVGQWRVVVGAERGPKKTTLRLDRAWRVVPDRTSRITLTTAYRQNIIFNNQIDAGFIDPRSKVAGVLFWFNAVDNVIAGCTMRHVGYGAGFNASFRNPCCWNLVRDNVMEEMGGMAVECAEPAFYFDSCRTAGGPDGPLFRPGSDVAGWYTVGNVSRSNRGHGSPTAAFIHAATTDAGSRLIPVQEEAGVVMPVVENNHFTGVERGIVVNRGAVWPVLRNNTIETTDPGSAAVYDQAAPR